MEAIISNSWPGRFAGNWHIHPPLFHADGWSNGEGPSPSDVEIAARRGQGLVFVFDPKGFDHDAPFFKIGNGSLGGKARGLAFMSTLLQIHTDLGQDTDADIFVPQSLVITTDVFAEFIDTNQLHDFATSDSRDEDVAEAFSRAELPEW